VWTLRLTGDEEGDSRLVRRPSRTPAGVRSEFQYRAADVSACGAALAGVWREADCLDAVGTHALVSCVLKRNFGLRFGGEVVVP